ncbi:prolyl oligopeptidase family serine peptidase [Chryseobacterium sp. SL1]|uniref:prolyl oligopeptidase family serine peptidase n=1 Tax=Chryseobacterium sp. SL1 TaxID=2995159 RepID=UPI0022746774|nr:prolyl oligopeptidase family serine peptidase [Chryseobacterium sp. SL1]MCY1661032.1 prolyl oligopeptidase family serine peptidase [Chryseobacterium sp. SL1]
MKNKIFIITIFLSVFIQAQETNLAPSVPVTEEHFGIKVIDDYRNLEDLNNPSTQQWMKSQTDYTNSILRKIPNWDNYLKLRTELDKKQGYSVSDLRITSNDKYFYLKRNAGEKTSKVYYRSGFAGKEELLYDPSNFVSANTNKAANHHEFIINVISPSWDGSRLAISLSEKGKEISEVIIMDVKSKSIHPEIITQLNPSTIGGIKWLGDNSGFFYVYYPDVDVKSSLFAKNTQTILYKIGEDPNKRNVVFSNLNNQDLKIKKEEYPAILTYDPKDQYYIGILVDAEDFRKTFIIDKKDLLSGKKNWKPLYNKDDKVFFLRVAGNEIYFLSALNSPNYKLCKTDLANPDFKNPEILVSEKKGEVLEGYSLTKDGIYYNTTKNGVEGKLYLLQDHKEIEIKLPFVSGNIDLSSKGKDFPDIWVKCSGWANVEQRYKYTLSTNTFTQENLAPILEYPEFKDVIVEEISVKSYDGTEVPLSLIYSKNLKKDGSAPVLMQGYGAFGESYSPFFAISYLSWASQGGIIAVPHVRGGGEKGAQWHVEGQKLKKPNSWKDLIACAEYLIDEKYTSSKKIGVWGASAGGILVGRAITERPDLFGVAIVESGVLNPLRVEKSGNGGTSIKEYGDPKDPNEFKGVLEMDAYQHIKKGGDYPAMLICAGINDPRVAPWQSSKFSAKALASNKSDKPILLDIDYEGGHGGDITVLKRYTSLSEIFAFAFWQLGHPNYQPKE